VLTHARWESVAGLRHGFLDGTESARRLEALGGGSGAPPLLLPRQVHGARVVTATRGATPPEADGLVVGTAGQLVGVVTADCVPVLLVDLRRRVAAAVHAGWRGAAAGVLEAALGHLVRAGCRPGDVEAALGPAIGGCCYEVGPEVAAAFRARTGHATTAAWSVRRGRDHLDLRTAARALLLDGGVGGVEVLGPCTACGDGYCSYRRDGRGAGRQLSFIGWA
jgi:hypothetical protein